MERVGSVPSSKWQYEPTLAAQQSLSANVPAICFNSRTLYRVPHGSSVLISVWTALLLEMKLVI